MKKRILTFAVAIVAVVALVVVSNLDSDNTSNKAGGLSLNLQEANAQKDTTITNIVSFAEVNQTSEEGLFQILSVGSWEHQHNGYYVGADFIATVSTQFGVVCPTYDARLGINMGNGKLEVKAGNFTRNGVKTAGFDPQFINFCTLAGEAAPVSKAVQLSYIGKSTKVMVGHQGGDKFYSFKDGNYYLCMEQAIKNVALSGGVNFTEQTTGYAAMKWTAGNDVFTATANNICAEGQNFVISYNHANINVGKGMKMNVGCALWNQTQTEKSGIQMVAGLNKGRVNLFAQAGGYLLSPTFTPVWGLGLNYKL